MREALAFELFHITGANPKAPREMSNDAWRSDSTARKSSREMVDELIGSLENAGIRLAISNSKKLLDHIETLITIPARSAYVLDNTDKS
jgi:hypothetical protein